MENENNNKSNEPKLSVSEVLNTLSKLNLISPQDAIFAKITGQFVYVLTRIRTDNEYTIEEFANILNTDIDTVNEWETGHHNFNLKEISEICYNLDLDLDFVVTQKENKNVED